MVCRMVLCGLCYFHFNLGHPLFYLRLGHQTDRDDVVKPFFTFNNSFNLKNEHDNSIDKTIS